MSRSLPPHFEEDQKFVLPPVDTFASSVKGGTFIVTGSNTGLGFEAAQSLVRLGASKVILAVRTISKGEEAQSKIEAETGIQGTTEVWALDMSNYQSVIDFAQRVKTLDRVDGVIENAGIALAHWSVGDKGVETTLIVNVTGTVLLAALLLDTLKESAQKHGIQPHLSIVGSGVALQDNARDELNKAPESENIIQYFSDESHGIESMYAPFSV